MYIWSDPYLKLSQKSEFLHAVREEGCFFKGGKKRRQKKRRKRKKLKERNRMPERDYGLSSWWSRSFSVPSGVRAQDRKPVLHPREGGEGRSHTGSHSGYQLILSRRLETFKSETRNCSWYVNDIRIHQEQIKTGHLPTTTSPIIGLFCIWTHAHIMRLKRAFIVFSNEMRSLYLYVLIIV